MLAQLVGPAGRVIGVDMTDEQLTVARRHLDFHADRFGFANVEFVSGYIEDLAAAGIADESVDLVVSNCVVNLSPDKPRRIPAQLKTDPVLLGECLAGALYVEDFRRILARSCCVDARVVTQSPLSIDAEDIERKIGFVTFSSRIVRAFKLPLEDRCEDFGQVATYLGALAEHYGEFACGLAEQVADGAACC